MEKAAKEKMLQQITNVEQLLLYITTLLLQPFVSRYNVYDLLEDDIFLDKLSFYIYLAFKDITLSDEDKSLINYYVTNNDFKEQIIDMLEDISSNRLDVMQSLDQFYLENKDIVDSITQLFIEDFESSYENTELKQESLSLSYVEMESTKTTSKTKTNTTAYRFVLHKHTAKRAGVHFDFRIEYAKDYVYSIAFRYNPFEQSKSLGIPQPIHESYWIDFEGEIKEGYGAGKVEIVAKGYAKFYQTDKGTLIIDTVSKKYGQVTFAIVKLDDDNKIMVVKTKKYNSEESKKELKIPTKKEIDKLLR